MELDEKEREEFGEVWVLPEAIGRGGEAGLGETDLAPEEIAVREGHGAGGLRACGSSCPLCRSTVIHHDVRGHRG